MMSNGDIAAQFFSDIFSGSMSLAGLVLVFLGFVVSSYESFDEEAKTVVRGKYKCRATLAFLGLISALAAAILVLIGKWLSSPACLYVGTAALAVSIVVVVILAAITLGSI